MKTMDNTRRLKDACANAAARAERAHLALEVAELELKAARDAYFASRIEDAKPTIEKMIANPDLYLNEEEKAYCFSSQMIQAIKSLRNRINGLGLKDAKDVVDAYRSKKGL